MDRISVKKCVIVKKNKVHFSKQLHFQSIGLRVKRTDVVICFQLNR